MPCLDILISLTLTPGAKLGIKLGTTYSNILMLTIHLISLAILVLANRFYLIIISLGIFGLGSGLAHITYMRNCYKYFPDHQGVVNGTIISSSGIVATILTAIADFIVVNPNREETINGIYPKHVANNVSDYSKVVAAILGMTDLIGFLLIFDYNEISETKEEKIKKLNEKKRNSLEAIDINSSNDEYNVSNSENTTQNINNNKLKLKNAFFSKVNLQFFSFCFCGFCKL